MRFLLIALILLTACGQSIDPPDRQSVLKQRQEYADDVLSKTPVPRRYSISGNELQVLDIPVKDSAGFLETQRCFVWRDTEFKSAAISCNQQADIVLSN